MASRSKVDVALLAAGLIGAAASGVAAYRIVGPYGDGPLNVGLYRAQDPETGRQLVYRDVRVANNVTLRYFFEDTTRQFLEVRLVREGQADMTFPRNEKERIPAGTAGVQALIKTGVSLGGDGIIDAWTYRDALGRVHRIDVSRRRNGTVDRWEFYKDNQLARVEQDDDGDGRVDCWLTYDAGIMIHDARDSDGDGRPDPGR